MNEKKQNCISKDESSSDSKKEEKKQEEKKDLNVKNSSELNVTPGEEKEEKNKNSCSMKSNDIIEKKENNEQNGNLYDENGDVPPPPSNEELEAILYEEKEEKNLSKSTKLNDGNHKIEKNGGKEEKKIPTKKMKLIPDKKIGKRKNERKKKSRLNEKKNKKILKYYKKNKITKKSEKIIKKKEKIESKEIILSKVLLYILLYKRLVYIFGSFGETYSSSNSNRPPPSKDKKLLKYECFPDLNFIKYLNSLHNDDDVIKEDDNVIRNMCSNHDRNIPPLGLYNLYNLLLLDSTNYSTN